MNVDVGFKRKRRERDARRGRLGEGVYQRLVSQLAETIQLAFDAGATATLWGLEGPLRHAIRSDLCLQRWKWIEADRMAREVLEDAFRRLNTKRPDWEEGQQEWTIATNIVIGRTQCARCRAPLPEGHHKYCGRLCADAHMKWLARLKEVSEDQAIDMATRSI